MRLEFSRTEFQRIDDLLQNLQKEDLIVITTEDKEVLHNRVPYQEWVQYQNKHYHWFYMEGTWPEDNNTYRMVICLPPDLYASYRKPETDKEKNLIFMLLSACFLPLPKFSFQKENISESEELYKSTRLDTLVNLIPGLSGAWEYSAVFIPDQKDPPRMVCLTKSQEFPTGILKDLQVPVGQLLTGWAYANNQYIVVKRVNDEDPRFLDRQTQEVIAVPTTNDDHPNGVLFIGSQHPAKGAFICPEQMCYLNIIGRIIGELIELENMRMRNIKLVGEVYR